jgi:hypothetical protein
MNTFYFCRMHGEPLLWDYQGLWWRCPEFFVCGTFVTDEHYHRTH